MTQVHLIFWKDARALWWQVTAYAGLLAVYAWSLPQTWPGGTPNSFLATLVTLLSILIMASQFVLITSVIHTDRLVGEDQFWITRPYDWRSLLGAKFLFVFMCVVLPLVLTQWYLLQAASLNPFAAKLGMTSSLLKFVLVLCLPLMLVASVTQSIGAAFAFVAALLVVWAATLQFIFANTNLRMSPPFEHLVFSTFFGILLLAVLVYQFARRRTAHSRIAIALILALFLLLTFGYDRQGFGAPIHALIRKHFQMPSVASLQLAFGPGSVPYDEQDQDLQYLHNFVEVKLPIHLEDLPADAKIRAPNIAVTLTSNGMRYATPWQNASLTENAIGFAIPKDVYNRVAAAQTTMHVELIGEEIRPLHVQRVIAASQFTGVSNASCILADGKVSCRYAYQAMVPTHVEALTMKSACNAQDSGNLRGAWLLEFPPGGRVDPVVHENLSLPDRICPGSALTFTQYGSLYRFRLVMDVPSVMLRDYRAVSR